LKQFPNSLNGVLDKVGKCLFRPILNVDAEEIDKERYQTVYAKEGSAVAAPTAGLHFTREFLPLISKGIEVVSVSLDVSLGTFQPVRTMTFPCTGLLQNINCLSAESCRGDK
jgi:S-adenosylmethionine:tRNA ribosyltransferase-isomerase